MNWKGTGVVIGALAAVMLPGVAAAQCEGGVTTAGYYLSSGAYVAGGCSYTNPTTSGQMFPSGAQVGPTTNPAAGITRLPGQRVAAGLLPPSSDSLLDATSLRGPLTNQGAYTTTLGPGARAPIAAAGVAADTAAIAENTSGLDRFNPQPAMPHTTGLAAGNTASAPLGTATATSSYSTAGLPSLSVTGASAGMLPGMSANNPNPAYSVALPPGSQPARATETSGAAESLPPVPGRGGPTYLGEESAPAVVIVYPR